jgi:diguanylate cyclase (GGDEF)-like protein
MADLDHFKRINDTLGHLTGDAVLREAAIRIGRALRPYDALGRYGGEEFLIVIPGCDPADIFDVAERVRTSVAETPISTPAGAVPVTISLGAASTDGRPGFTSSSIIRLADTALYRAKSAGRDRVEIALSHDELLHALA